MARFASFSLRMFCKAFSRSRFADVVLPPRPIRPSFSWYSQPVNRQVTVVIDYSVAPRRRVPRTRACEPSSGAAPFIRERVPCPRPRLAMDDTACRIESMEADSPLSWGLDNPSTSHRIFSFRAGLRFRFFDCMLLINVVLFIVSSWGDSRETPAPSSAHAFPPSIFCRRR